MKYVASAADEKPSSKGWIKMTTLLECYKILEQYPDSMTKDQFYRIAHISKRHAKYLLDSGLVPCHDSGKKTRRYTIQTRDVVTFLCDREDNPDKYKAPKGLYIGNSGKAKRPQVNHRNYPVPFYRAGKDRAVQRVGTACRRL